MEALCSRALFVWGCLKNERKKEFGTLLLEVTRKRKINQMVLSKVKYKQTEIGMIPEG